MSDFLLFFFGVVGGGGGVWKVMLKEKGGSAKIKQAILHQPPLSINNDRSLSLIVNYMKLGGFRQVFENRCLGNG